jgi:poly(A) polymerase
VKARVVEGSLVDAPFLAQPRLRALLRTLNGAGEETRVVGGAVRNALLGEPVHEVDLATTMEPRQTMARAVAAGFKPVPTGVEHGTATIVVDGEPFEVTTLREDVETHGRHATVKFGRDFRADALRRDFTMNALFVDAQGRLHDHVDGLADISARRVRFIGDAATRIAEDYLRVLRFFRFHAACGEGAMDAQALHAAIAARDGLAGLSRERVRAELMKLLAARRARDVTRDMTHAGVLGPVLAGAPNPDRLARVKRMEGTCARAPDATLRLAGLCVQVEEDALRLRERLRLSNAESQRLTRAARAIVELHGRETPPASGDLRRFVHRHGAQAAGDALILACAESRADPDADVEHGPWALWAQAARAAYASPPMTSPFAGADLIARGVARGPAMGAALKRLEAEWAAADFPREPVELARILDKVAPAAEPWTLRKPRD